MYISIILLIIMKKKKKITVPDVDIASKLWKAMVFVL